MAQPDGIFLTASAIVTVGVGANGTKVANATTHQLTFRTNSGKTPASDGLVISRGFFMGDVTLATMETVDGQSNTLKRAAANNDVVTVAFTHGGMTFVIVGTFDEFSLNSTVERGATEGSYKISGKISIN